jgi:hypothetical protein
MSALSTLGTGLGLSIGAGLNAYAVLLVYGVLARLDPAGFPGGVSRGLSTTPVLLTLCGLYLLEFLADKIPGLDHLWDLLHAVVRPLAGALLAFAVAQNSAVPGAGAAGGAGLVMQGGAAGLGGLLAFAAHLVKSATRLTSTALTAGVANIALSVAEDILAFLQAVVSVFLPLIALAVVGGFVVLFLFTVPRVARTVNLVGRRRGGAPRSGRPPESPGAGMETGRVEKGTGAGR